MVKLIASVDDGHKDDFKFAALCQAHNIPALFYIPSDCRGMTPEEQFSEDDIRDLSSISKFEMGGHTMTHPPDLKKLDDKELKKEIEQNKKWLEKVVGNKVNHFAYPRGRYNERTIEAIKKAGYKSARTTLVGYTDTPDDPYRIHTTVHVHPKRVEYKGQDWLAYAYDKYYEAIKKDGYYHLWGHGWEIEKYGLWNELEELLKYINNTSDVWEQYEFKIT